jgi:ATP diphosphatase
LAERPRGDPENRRGDRRAVGDLLFAAANLARKLEIEPETALRRATAKFERRFRRVEALAKERGIGPDLDALEELWEQVKAEEQR